MWQLLREYLAELTPLKGIDAEYVSLENVVPPHDDVEGSLGQSFYDSVSEAFAERVKQSAPRVPVVTGMFHKTFPFASCLHCYWQATLDQFPVRYFGTSGEDTQTWQQHYSQQAFMLQNCRYGKK